MISTASERGQAAGRAGNALDGVDHEHEHTELTLHHLGQSCGRDVAQLEFGGKALARSSRIFIAVARGEPERPAQERDRPADLRSERAIGGDPAPGAALEGVKADQADAGLPPGEFALAHEQERDW